MNANEPLTLSKMAVTVMMVVLVMVSALGLFFYFNDETLKFVRHMEKASTGAEIEKFISLEMDSKSEDGILVTSVCNALNDTNDTSLVFAHLVAPDGKFLYTYENYNVNSADFPDTTIKQSRSMINMTIKGLMRYAGKRCEVSVIYTDEKQHDLEGINILIK